MKQELRTLRCAVDRREGDYLVLVADVGEDQFDVLAADYPSLAVQDVADVVADGDTVVSITVIEGEGQRRAKENLDRLHALFNRGKK